MTAFPPASSIEPWLARYARERESLGGDLATRDAAADWLRRHGLPTARDEAWKYTSLQSVLALAETPRLSTPASVPPAAANLSDAVVMIGSEGAVQSISDRAAAFVRPGPPGTRMTDAAVVLNTMFGQGGAHITVPANTDAGLLVLAHADAAQPHHTVVLAEGASLTLLETAESTGPLLTNLVCDIRLEPGAHLRHVRLQLEDIRAAHLATITATVAETARYDAFTLSLGAALARAATTIALTGPGAHTTLNAAQRLSHAQHADITTVVRHAAPDCTSRQTVKNVLDGRARAVFQGRIEVARAAQRTDGYQMNQALLLSDTAEIDSKPELEIFADDVKCSHGATVGALDEEQLFYLASRGIPREAARAILVRAFLDDALSEIADGRIQAFIGTLLDAAS